MSVNSPSRHKRVLLSVRSDHRIFLDAIWNWRTQRRRALPPPSHPFSPAASSAAASTAISSLSPFRPRVGDRGPSFPTAKRGAIRRQVENGTAIEKMLLKGEARFPLLFVVLVLLCPRRRHVRRPFNNIFARNEDWPGAHSAARMGRRRSC